MRTLKYLITAAMAAALAFASCTKEIEAPEETGQEEERYSRETGAPVVFGVSIKKDNNQDTKAEYSEELFTSIGGKLQKIGEVSTGYEIEPDTKAQYEENDILYGGLQRINWELNDKIEIFNRYSPNVKLAEYRISENPSTLANISIAKIEKVGEGLQWGENGYNGKFVFGAIYPSPLREGQPIQPGENQIIFRPYSLIGGSVSYTVNIPKIQFSKGKPIMVATTEVDKSSGSPILLNFTPAVKTFEIKISNARVNPINVKSVRLESLLDDISGNYHIESEIGRPIIDYQFIPPTPSNIFPPFERHKTVEHFFGDSGKTLNPYKELSVRLYTFPMDIKDLTLVIEETDGTKTSLELKDRTGQWIKFEGTRKYRINDIRIPENPDPTHTYTFEVEREGADTLYCTPIKTLYHPLMKRRGARLVDLDKTEVHDAKVKSYKTSLEDGSITAVPWDITTTDGNIWIDEYSTHSATHPGGTEWEKFYFRSTESPFLMPDNQHYVYQDSSRRFRDRRSENYVYDLSREGGLSTGIRNTANCYRITKNGEYKFPLIYGNCIKNNEINYGAFIDSGNGSNMFVDGAGNPINSANYKVNATSVDIVWYGPYGSSTIAPREMEVITEGEGEEQERYVYMKFFRTAGYGNLIIAARNQENKILWTWHIWIVPDLEEGLQPGQISKRPLGYVMDRGGLLAHVTKANLVQKDIKGKSYSMNLKYQRTYSQESCLYYTYGRMTPSIPTSGQYFKDKGTDPKNFVAFDECKAYISGEIRYFEAILNQGQLEVSQAISAPGTISTITSPYQNLWSNTYNGNSEKTVYDPCPAGYRVPKQSELNNLSSDFFTNITKYGAIKEWGPLPRPWSNFSTFYFDGFTEKVYMLSSDRTYREYPAEGTQVKYAPIFPIKE